MIKFVIIADAGGTKTVAKGIRIRDSAVYGSVQPPCVPSADFQGAIDTVDRVAIELATLAGDDARRETCAIALSSAGLDMPAVRSRFCSSLTDRFAQVRLASDGEAALLGCVGDGYGAVLAIGTGVVAHGRLPCAPAMTFGGWGWPAGDAGGGAWVGRRCVEEFLDAADAGQIGADRLLQRLAALIGSGRQEILDWLGCAGRQDYAALAKVVVEAASDTSLLGARLLAEAGARVSLMVQALSAAGHDEVCLTGGLADALRPFIVGADLRLVPNASLAGAHHIAAPWLGNCASPPAGLPG